MRIKVSPPPALAPSLPPGALLTVRVDAADPAALISGPLSIAYEGRWSSSEGAFLFPSPAAPAARGVTTPSKSGFRNPPAVDALDHVDVPLALGDRVVAALIVDNKTYSAAVALPVDPLNQPTGLTLVLSEGAATPQPPPTPQPAPGLTITPDPGDPDVLTLDPAPGNDTIVVVK